ncbi:hypothetical protein JB92DRAFT_2831965 [Gautieria morchelliformis]|nr:hypothetical protein JB92DRAFT_2831965 [Gautieria morchelliformis]
MYFYVSTVPNIQTACAHTIITSYPHTAIPSLIQQVAEMDGLVGKVARASEEDNKNILGTLEAQDKDLTNLEARFKSFEEPSEKITRAKCLGGGEVPGSDEKEVDGNTATL